MVQYANAHLDQQILVLRDFITSLSENTPTGSSDNALIAASAAHTLTSIKRDVVETIRRVVDVVSKYAGAALPEHARRFVRQSILSLPVKWANSIATRPTPVPAQQAYLEARAMSESNGISSPVTPSTQPTSITKEAAERVLTFAVESLDMLRGLTQIFGDSVERAEAWVERLRIVGLNQRERQARDEIETRAIEQAPNPWTDGSGNSIRHRQTMASNDQDEEMEL